jgi:hypothetical protein
MLTIAVLSFPIIFFWLYLTSLEKRTKRIVKIYSDSSSKIYKDLKVWIKNFDVFRKKSKFDLDPYQILYSYNDCDLILNERNFVVIGKTKILGKNKPLSPTIFDFEKNGVGLKQRHVKIENIQEVGSDLEIEFTDDNFLDRMTLVIKGADNELKEKIKTGYNNS